MVIAMLVVHVFASEFEKKLPAKKKMLPLRRCIPAGVFLFMYMYEIVCIYVTDMCFSMIVI